MQKRYYIASGLDNVDKVRELKSVLDAAGWEHTYDWTVHGAVYGAGLEKLAETAEAEVKGVFTAPLFIALLPGGRGTHNELGIAIGEELMFNYWRCGATDRRDGQHRILVYSADPADFEANEKTCAFYHHPFVERFTDMETMIKSILDCGETDEDVVNRIVREILDGGVS